MSQGVVIIGAGPAGILATNKLLESGKVLANHIILTYTGLDPWARAIQDDITEGFLGALLGRDIVLAGTPDMGGDLASYVGEQQAQQLFTEAYTVVKDTIKSENTPVVKYSPHKHYTLSKEGVEEFAKLMWLKFRKAGVRIHQQQLDFQPDVVYSKFDDLPIGVVFDNYIIATGRTGYGAIHHYRETNGGVLQTDITYENNKHQLIHSRIPDWYLQKAYQITTRPNSQFQVVDGSNVYAVGDILGTRCAMTAMAQGIAAANNIIINL